MPNYVILWATKSGAIGTQFAADTEGLEIITKDLRSVGYEPTVYTVNVELTEGV